MDISTLLYSIDLTKTLAGYMGLIESIDAKLDRLSGSELEAGLRTLKQAVNSTDTEIVYLLRDARSFFNKSISLEEDERLFIAYAGLAICHRNLKDNANLKDAVKSACQVDISDSKAASASKLVGKFLWFDAIGFAANAYSHHVDEANMLRREKLKQAQAELTKAFLS